jgi:hypothetical protein
MESLRNLVGFAATSNSVENLGSRQGKDSSNDPVHKLIFDMHQEEKKR